MDYPMLTSPVTRQSDQPCASLVAIASGKGGVGKSNIAANLAIALARSGKRVRLVDADLSLGNVDILMNVHSRHTLSDVVSGRRALQEVIHEGPEGVEVVCAASGSERLADLDEGQRRRLIHGLAELRRDTDFLVVDTAAVIAKTVTSFCLAADHVWVVTTPDGTAMADAYGLIKVLVRNGFGGQISLMVNLADSPSQGKRIYQQIGRVARQFLGASIHYAGSLPHDTHMVAAARSRRPVLTAYPKSPVAVAITAMAAGLAIGDAVKTETRPFLRKVVSWLC
jgi:flagellar biosynthesis protein FlhG